jgi:hypothetical protein
MGGREQEVALGFVNEYSGHAVLPASYIAFAELNHRGSPTINLTLQEVRQEASFRQRVLEDQEVEKGVEGPLRPRAAF